MNKRNAKKESAPVYDGRKVALLRELASKLVVELETIDGVREGEVHYRGATAPYRRVDCDRRVFAYVRVRPRHRAVRVDINGIWKVGATRHRIESSSATTLLLRSEIDIVEAVKVLASAIEYWRRARS